MCVYVQYTRVRLVFAEPIVSLVFLSVFRIGLFAFRLVINI